MQAERENYYEERVESVRETRNLADVENIAPPPSPRTDSTARRAVSADGRRSGRTDDVEVDGPPVMVTDRQSRPFTELVRLQRPAQTRQHWERVRARAQQSQSAAGAAATEGASDKPASADGTCSDRRLPVRG